jgi:hypothetical protein
MHNLDLALHPSSTWLFILVSHLNSAVGDFNFHPDPVRLYKILERNSQQELQEEK